MFSLLVATKSAMSSTSPRDMVKDENKVDDASTVVDPALRDRF